MQKEDTTTSLRNASPSVSRRLILKSALAGTAAFTMQLPAANAAPVVLDHLDRLIAEYEVIRKRRDFLARELDRLESDPCQPRAFVALRDVASRELDYLPEFRDEIFVTEHQVEQFFADHECDFSKTMFHAIHARRRDDCDRAKALVRETRTALSEWEQKSGYDVLDEECTALAFRETEIEDEICERPCESVNDALRKALFAASTRNDIEIGCRKVWTLVETIADFAKGRGVDDCPGRDTGQTDPALLARIEDYKLARAAFSLSVGRNAAMEALPQTSPIVLEYMRAHELLDERMVAAGRALLSHPCHTLRDIRVKARFVAGDEILGHTAEENLPEFLEALCHA